MLGTYKYTIPMPPTSRDTKYIKEQFTKEKFEQLLAKKIEVLISPVYLREDGIMFYNPIIDIDFKHSSEGTAFVTTKKILYNIRSKTDYKLKDFIVECTGTGFHIVSNRAFQIKKDDLDQYRKVCRIISAAIDCTSSFRDTPVRRIGGFKQFVIYPILAENFIELRKSPKKYKDHLSFCSKEEWRKFLNDWLIPKRFIMESFDVSTIDV